MLGGILESSASFDGEDWYHSFVWKDEAGNTIKLPFYNPIDVAKFLQECDRRLNINITGATEEQYSQWLERTTSCPSVKWGDKL